MMMDRNGEWIPELPDGKEVKMTLARLIDILETHECHHREQIDAIQFTPEGIQFIVGYRDI